jgi:hypothetical protein
MKGQRIDEFIYSTANRTGTTQEGTGYFEVFQPPVRGEKGGARPVHRGCKSIEIQVKHMTETVHTLRKELKDL